VAYSMSEPNRLRRMSIYVFGPPEHEPLHNEMHSLLNNILQPAGSADERYALKRLHNIMMPGEVESTVPTNGCGKEELAIDESGPCWCICHPDPSSWTSSSNIGDQSSVSTDS
jgi:hypothetical protein